MLHPHTELKTVNPNMGYGVFATIPIPKGTITWVLDPLDQLLDTRRLEELGARYREAVERYTWTNRDGDRILCWDFARFMNHDCTANTMAAGGFDFEIALRDIAAGEQLTSDYATLNLERPFRCGCDSGSCRGTIHPEDFEALAPRWDELIRDAFADIPQTLQPLWPWVREKRIVRRAMDRAGDLPSIMSHRFHPLEGTREWQTRVTAS